MRNLVFLLFLALCAFVVIGWFLDWYTIAGLQGSGGAKVQIELHTDKIKEDIDKGIQKGRSALEQLDSAPSSKPEPIISMPNEAEKP